jgi:DNA repair protein RecN (Recombination protein N)
VICITHLPQVAVHATAHFVVSKSVREGRTYSAVEQAAGERRIGEIVRMLGGDPASEVSVRHAREMLRRARDG